MRTAYSSTWKISNAISNFKIKESLALQGKYHNPLGNLKENEKQKLWLYNVAMDTNDVILSSVYIHMNCIFMYMYI